MHWIQALPSWAPLVVEAPTIWPALVQKPPADTAISLGWHTWMDIHELPLNLPLVLRVVQLLIALGGGMAATGWQQVAYHVAGPCLEHHSHTSRSRRSLVVEAPIIAPAPVQKPLPEMATSFSLHTVWDAQLLLAYLPSTVRVTHWVMTLGSSARLSVARRVVAARSPPRMRAEVMRMVPRFHPGSVRVSMDGPHRSRRARREWYSGRMGAREGEAGIPGVRRVALLVVLLSAGCSAQEVSRVVVDALEPEVGALVVTDAEARPLRIAGVIRPGREALPAVTLEDGERAFVVALTGAELRAATPSLGRAPLESFELEVGAPPAALELSPRGDSQGARLPLPPGTRVVDVDLSPAPAVVAASLTAALLLPPDDAGALALHPFGDAGTLVPFGTVIPDEGATGAHTASLRRVVALTADRVLVMSERFLATVERGAPLVPVQDPSRPGPFVHVDRLSHERIGQGHLLRDLALDRSGTGGWAVGEIRGVGGRIWTFSVGPGGIMPTGTATITPHPSWMTTSELLSVGVDERGSVIVGGGNAQLLVKGPDAAAFTGRARLLTLHREWVTRDSGYLSEITDVVASGDAQHPHLLGTQGARVLSGNAERDEWALVVDASNYQGSLMEPHVTQIATDATSGETWVATRGGGLARRASAAAPWGAVRVPVPTALQVCATSTPEGGYWFPRLHGVVLDETYAWVVIADCSALLRIRRDDGSTAAITRAGEIPRREETTDFVALTRGPRGVIAVGGQGSVYEVRE